MTATQSPETPLVKEKPATGPSGATEESPSPAEAPIGHKDEPVRALAFSSGGVETAMQLGVVHALLVTRAPPPDVVLGVSAGAVNAVALAEILQAGSDGASDAEDAPNGRDPYEPKVARFRRILEDFQNCPRDLLDSMLPDTYQIDAQKPLKPLRLPIHAKAERDGRDEGLRSRAGLINFYNELLLLRASIGTIARAVRRVLGVVAAREAAPKIWRAIRILETFQLWVLLGANLHQVAPVLWPLTRAALKWAPWTATLRKEHGVTAASLIFRSGLWTRIGSLARTAISLLLLSSLWVVLSLLVVGLITLLGHLPLRIFRDFSASIAGIDNAFMGMVGILSDWPNHRFPSLALYAPTIGAVVLSALGFAVIYGVVAAWLTKERYRVMVFHTVGRLVSFYLLVALWSVVLTLLSGGTAYMLNKVGRFVVDALPWIRLPHPQVGALHVMSAAFVAAFIIALLMWGRRRRFLLNLLSRYGLADSLLHPHPLRQFFVRLFDPGYYGGVAMDNVVERALRRDEAPSEQSPGQKLLKDYAQHPTRPIHVALTVADVSTGKLSVVSEGVRTVDALMAATAATPFFPPVPTEGHLYVDAANVATQATDALMDFLRPRVRPEAPALHVYSVSTLPLSRAELGPQGKRPKEVEQSAQTPEGTTRTAAGEAHGNGAGSVGASVEDGKSHCLPSERTDLVEVVVRAWQIQRFRDAHLDQKLINLLSRVLPPGEVVSHCAGDDYLRAWVYPIEPDVPLDVLSRLARASTVADRREVVAQTVADGCRAALQTMLAYRIREVAATGGSVVKDGVQAVWCASVIEAHRRDQNQPLEFPGSAPKLSPGERPTPGLVEVCQHCALYRAEQPPRNRHLIAPAIQTNPPDWFLKDRHAQQGVMKSARQPPVEKQMAAGNPTVEALKAWHEQGKGKNWPLPKGNLPGGKRPLVSFLFSGGVFRGVYQMGVLNALNLVGLRPDVIAGASVGSITAAMVARVFREPHPNERAGRIARLAATYLTLDRLILTDRFADFIRGFTVRAAATRFSLSQADRVFRSFDKAMPGDFARELRAVTAGLERLFYISPFELKDLVEAARRRQVSQVARGLKESLKEWLGRMGVGNQVLGAEPLALLIAEHVLEGLPGYSAENAGTIPFDVFSEDGIYFLATATNLTQGRLEILGERPVVRPSEPVTMLLDGLLASSAFPGVFRPRWSWEVMPAAQTADQYIDGGVTDNLPLDAVAQFLHHAGKADLIAARPANNTPHLLLCASLEPKLPHLTPDEQQALRFNWPGLSRRAAQLGYNNKIDLYAEIQRSVREIMASTAGVARDWIPLDLEVVAIKPEWLCSTFAFHPMLNFRRSAQARSIAHGCASTLLELARERPDDKTGSWRKAWGIDESRLPDAAVACRPDPYIPLPVGKDECWFKSGVICPFSRTGLSQARLLDTTMNELANIYQLCGRHDTHRPTA